MAPAKRRHKLPAVIPARVHERDVVRHHLREHVRNLRLVRCVITVSSEMLRYQNVDYDADVAQLLQHDAGNRLDDQIGKTEGLLSRMNAHGAASRKVRLRKPGRAAQAARESA